VAFRKGSHHHIKGRFKKQAGQVLAYLGQQIV
jgi:hypothetical protein